MNVALSGAYTHHVKTLRDAVRTWDAITPSVPAHSVSRRYSISFKKKYGSSKNYVDNMI